MSPTSYHCSTPPVIVPAGGPDGRTAAPGGRRVSEVPARGVDNLTTAPFDALMSLFSSRRERRLWAWTLLVVVAIYSTLGLAWTLAGALRDSGLLDRSLPVLMFLMGMVLVGATIVTRGLKVRPGGVEIAVALGVATAYFMVFVRIAILEERTHLIEYSVVAGLIHEALTERASQGSPRSPAGPARLPGRGADRRAGRGHPGVSPESRVRPAGHAVQRAGGRDGGCGGRGAGMGAAADKQVPPLAAESVHRDQQDDQSARCVDSNVARPSRAMASLTKGAVPAR